MLIEMRFINFFSIKDEVSIDFKTGNINTASTKELSDNIFSVNDKTFLKVQGLFGPNASGKSSILKAALFCRQLILDSFQNNEGSFFNFMPFKDEIQRVPELLSTVQVRIDKNKKKGQYIITGSQQIPLKSSVSQSLAGRIAVVQMLNVRTDAEAKKNFVQQTTR